MRGIVKGGLNDGGSNIKSIQRGMYNVTDTTTTIDISIANVDLTKSVPTISFDASYGNQMADLWKCELTSSTNLRITRIGLIATNIFVSWEVIEYNNVKSLQSGLCAANAYPFSVSISNIDTSKSKLFYSFTNSYNNSDTEQYCFVSGFIKNSTLIEFRGYMANINQYNIQWYVIEFN